ncbi:putative symporter YagG [compost metagenome]
MMVGLKTGLSVGGALTTLFLGYFHYVPNALQQSEIAINGIKLLVSIFPAIPFLIGAGLLFFYKINKEMEVQIETELKERRA